MGNTENGRLHQRVCVVAGVAGALGEGIAKRFADEGGIVVGMDRKDHDLGTPAIQCELTDEEQVRSAYERVYRELGRVDVIYNNAGVIDPDDHSALDTTLATWNRVFADNLTATWLSCKHGIAEEAARRFRHMPMGRFGTMEEFTATAAYLASDDAGFVTAAAFPINGGIPHAFTVDADHLGGEN